MDLSFAMKYKQETIVHRQQATETVAHIQLRLTCFDNVDNYQLGRNSVIAQEQCDLVLLENVSLRLRLRRLNTSCHSAYSFSID